jgi:hypothetical protein
MESLERSQDPIALLADRLGASNEGASLATTSVKNMLAEGSPILVLDGATWRGAAPLVAFLTDSCPAVTTVLTCRQPQELPYAHVLRVGPLRLLPASHPETYSVAHDAGQVPGTPTSAEQQVTQRSDAAEFLRSEAIRLGADPAIWTDSECEHVANQLDGIALGLSLAAKRASVMSPQAMRLALKQRGPSALDHGHDEGLASVLGWTIAELSLPARTVLEALAVLPEPLEFDAAWQICTANVVDENDSSSHDDVARSNPALSRAHTNPSEFAGALTELLNAGLLRRITAFGRARFSILGVAALALHERQSADVRTVVLAAHARYFVNLANRSAQAIRSSDEHDAVRLIELEIVNFTTAIDWLLQQGHIDDALLLSKDLVGFAFYRLNQTLASAIVRVVSSPGASTSKHFREACATAALMAWMLGDAVKAKTFLGWSQAPADSWVYRQAAGVIALYSGDTASSGEHFQCSLTIAEANGSPYEQAISLSQITLLRTFDGRADALDSAIESFRCGEASNNPTALANGAWAMGIALLDIDPEGAREHLLACRTLALSVNARLSAGSADAPLAMLQHRIGATDDERRETLQRQMKFWLESSHSAQFWLVAQEAAVLLCERGSHRSAALILGAVSAAPFKVPLPGAERRTVQRTTETLARELGDRYATIHHMGTALSATSCGELIQRELAEFGR